MFMRSKLGHKAVLHSCMSCCTFVHEANHILIENTHGEYFPRGIIVENGMSIPGYIHPEFEFSLLYLDEMLMQGGSWPHKSDEILLRRHVSPFSRKHSEP